jgi:hypothetical protein
MRNGESKEAGRRLRGVEREGERPAAAGDKKLLIGERRLRAVRFVQRCWMDPVVENEMGGEDVIGKLSIWRLELSAEQ